MSDFEKYSYRERVVKAKKLSGTTLVDVVPVLAKEAEDEKLERLTLAWNPAKSCYDIRFRYKDDKVDTTLQSTDWLVESLATGKFRTMTDKAFNAEYEDWASSGAVVESATLPE